MRTAKKFRIAMPVIAVLVLCSCENKNWESMQPAGGAAAIVCDTSQVPSYATDIAPIMVNSCGANDNNCHSSSVGSGSTVLDVWIGVNYSAVVATPSKFISCIVWDGQSSPMPKSGVKLPPCDIMKIQKWVNAGAPNN